MMHQSTERTTNAMSKNPDELLSANQIAAELNVSIETVRRWLASGRLPKIKLNGGPLVRARRRDVAALLNARA